MKLAAAALLDGKTAFAAVYDGFIAAVIIFQCNIGWGDAVSGIEGDFQITGMDNDFSFHKYIPLNEKL
jgi:hypothetical protein